MAPQFAAAVVDTTNLELHAVWGACNLELLAVAISSDYERNFWHATQKFGCRRRRRRCRRRVSGCRRNTREARLSESGRLWTRAYAIWEINRRREAAHVKGS